MKTKSPNKFYTKDKFISYSSWKALDGGFVIFPTVWFRLNCKPSLEITVNKFTFAFALYRLQLNFGKYKKISFEGPIEWEELGFNEFFQWSKRKFNRDWNRIDVEKLFTLEPKLKKVIIMGTAHNHYVRVLLARAMLSAQENGRLGNNEKLGNALSKALNNPNLDSAKDIINSTQPSINESFDDSADLFGLSGLEQKIKEGALKK